MKGYIEIVDVIGREVMDSRGNPTVEVEVYVCLLYTSLEAGQRLHRRVRPGRQLRSVAAQPAGNHGR